MGGQVVSSTEAALPSKWGVGRDIFFEAVVIISFGLTSLQGGEANSMQGYLCKQIVLGLRKYEKMRL